MLGLALIHISKRVHWWLWSCQQGIWYTVPNDVVLPLKWLTNLTIDWAFLNCIEFKIRRNALLAHINRCQFLLLANGIYGVLRSLNGWQFSCHWGCIRKQKRVQGAYWRTTLDLPSVSARQAPLQGLFNWCKYNISVLDLSTSVYIED